MKKEENCMQEKGSLSDKVRLLIQAFPEFLGRPKTIFDIRDRCRMLLLLAAVIAVIEGVIYYLQK